MQFSDFAGAPSPWLWLSGNHGKPGGEGAKGPLLLTRIPAERNLGKVLVGFAEPGKTPAVRLNGTVLQDHVQHPPRPESSFPRSFGETGQQGLKASAVDRPRGPSGRAARDRRVKQVGPEPEQGCNPTSSGSHAHKWCAPTASFRRQPTGQIRCPLAPSTQRTVLIITPGRGCGKPGRQPPGVTAISHFQVLSSQQAVRQEFWAGADGHGDPWGRSEAHDTGSPVPKRRSCRGSFWLLPRPGDCGGERQLWSNF